MTRQPSGSADTNYLKILLRPRVGLFVGSSAVGRLGISVVPLSIILLVAAEQKSFASAGLCGGLFALTSAVLAPARARAVDQKGTAIVLGLLTPPFLLALVGVILSAAQPLPLTLTASAVVGALTPPIGAATKAQLSATFLASGDVQRAYAVDTVVDIGVLTAGPMVAGVLIGFSSTPFAIAIAAILVMAGCIGMVIRELSPTSARANLPKTGAVARTAWLRPATSWTLILSMVSTGSALGAIEIGVPAFANVQGNPAAAGLILGMFFGMSALSSLVYGSRHWTTSLTGRYRVAVVALALASLPLLMSQNLASLALLILLPGLFFGPALISAYLIAQEATPGNRQAEANAWISTANNAGAAVGLSIGGLVADQLGATPCFGVAALLAGLGACIAPRGLSQPPHEIPHDPDGMGS